MEYCCSVLEYYVGILHRCNHYISVSATIATIAFIASITFIAIRTIVAIIVRAYGRQSCLACDIRHKSGPSGSYATELAGARLGTWAWGAGGCLRVAHIHIREGTDGEPSGWGKRAVKGSVTKPCVLCYVNQKPQTPQ